MTTVGCEIVFYYIKFKTKHITLIMDFMLGPTDFRLNLDFVILVWLGRYNTNKA